MDSGNALQAEFATLASLVDTKLDSFITGSEEFQHAALAATKLAFDSSLKSEPDAFLHIEQLLRTLVPEEPIQTRSTGLVANGKRKRDRSPSPPHENSLMQVAKRLKPTPLEELYLQGMDEDQIWAQLELRAKGLCEVIEVLFEEDFQKEADVDEGSMEEMEGLEMEGEVPDDAEMEGIEGWESGSDEDDSSFEPSDVTSEESEIGSELGEGVAPLQDPDEESDFDIDLDRPLRLSPKPGTSTSKRRSGHPTLDDGFFSLAEFNAETEEAESRSRSRGNLGGDEDEDEDEDLEGSIDIFQSVDKPEVFRKDDPEIEAPELYYQDFFAPPARKVDGASKSGILGRTQGKSTKVRFHEEVRVKNIKSTKKRTSTLREQLLNGMFDSLDDEFGETDDPIATLVGDDDSDEDEETEEDGDGGGDEYGEEEDEDGDVEEDEDEDEEDGDEDEEEEEEGDDGEEDGWDSITRSQHDLFADDKDSSGDQDLSTHAARLLKLSEEIKSLEQQNVGKKDWTLTGEATAKTRPLNSLLEEDLEFERTTRAVPVITEEKVQSLESLIKARILENRFDDVVRKKPIDDKPFLPSKVFELQDSKSTQSLAQIYEDDYIAAQSGTAPADDRDGRLKKEHEELEKLWDGICHKLDALCNTHFTPKAPKATISTVSNVASASLESALPTTKSTTTLLAPEEVFSGSTSDVRSKAEMTPTEKRALRGKERKKRKKQRDLLEIGVAKSKKAGRGKANVKAEKEKALKNLVKVGKGVTVVGKKNQRHQPERLDGKKLKL